MFQLMKHQQHLCDELKISFGKNILAFQIIFILPTVFLESSIANIQMSFLHKSYCHSSPNNGKNCVMSNCL